MSYRLFNKYHKENIVLLIEEGSFYSSYMEDAYVLNYLLSFKIISSNSFVKVSFPKTSLDKVKNILEIRSCNYSILTKDKILIKCNPNNNYLKYLNQEQYLKDKLIKKLSNLNYEDLLSSLQDSFKL